MPNPEQCRLWRELELHPWVFAAKPRRVGFTTATQFDDMLWCATNDADGQRVRCGLYLDNDSKLAEREQFCRDIKRDLPDIFGGIDINSERVKFPHGSVLEFGNGSGKSEGRGGGFQRLHITELPFWQNKATYAALMPAMTETSIVIIETTLDVTAPNGTLARDVWQNPSNAFHRFFCRVEDFPAYRSVIPITDAEWEFCQKNGFTDRKAAAWWLKVALPNKVAGDPHRLLHEYPQTEGHLLASAGGLWVARPTAIIEPIDVVDIEGHKLLIFKKLEQTSRQLVVAVDVAKGNGGDASVIAVIDKKDDMLVAMLYDNLIRTPPLARATAKAVALYTTPRQSSIPGLIKNPDPIVPECIVETNGVGTGPVQQLWEAGVSAVDVHLAGVEGNSIMYNVLLLAGQAADEGRLRGPAELSRECSYLTRDPITGAWKGRKDGLVAVGHALRWVKLSPYVEPPTIKRDDVIDDDFIKRMMGQDGPRDVWG